MQYNWSHDNQGEGYLTLTWPIGFGFQRGVSHNIQMRYNIGERDGKKLAGAWYNFGGVENLFVYNNTLYYEPARVSIGGTQAFVCDAGAVACHDTWGAGGSTSTNYVWNNIFIVGTTNPSGGPSWLQWTDGTGTWTYDHNIWYRVQGGFETKDCANWACWQALGRDLNGYNANPGVVGPLGGGPAAYHLLAGSIAIDHARNVTESLRGMGPQDYFGLAIPQGSAYDIGAAEFNGGGGPTATPAPPTNTPTRTNTPVPPTATNTPGGPTNTPTNTSVPPTNTPTRTNTPVPPTATPGGSVVMHVADIYTTDVNGTPKDVFNGGDTIYWRAKIVDANNAAVSGATVTTTLTRSNGSQFGPYNSITDAGGWALFSQKSANAWPQGTTTVQVTNVTMTGATYNPAANVKTTHSFTLQ